MTLNHYHPRHQWINDAAVEFELEHSKPSGVKNDERIDALRSDILSGLREFFLTLAATRQTVGIHDQEDFVHDLLIDVMREGGWLDSYESAKLVPFLGYVADNAPGGVSHTIRKEKPGSGRTQDTARKVNKEVKAIQKEHPERDLDDIRIGVLNSMSGLGIAQIKNISSIKTKSKSLGTEITNIRFVGTEDPIGEGITLGDTLAHEENPAAIGTIDRTTLEIKLERMPFRYRRILDSMIDTGVEGLHDIKFGEALSLAEKVVLFHTAIQIGKERTTRLTGAILK